MDQDSICTQDRTRIADRAERVFGNELFVIRRRTDRLFAVLLSLQWVAALATAIWILPYAWAGTESYVHPHVLAATLLGVLFTLVPLLLIWKQPGSALTRQVIAVSQVSWSGLLIHWSAADWRRIFTYSVRWRFSPGIWTCACFRRPLSW